MAENFQIRDVFNPGNVTALSERLRAAWPAFEAGGFCQKIIPRLPELTYSERLQHISHTLDEHLPQAFPAAVEILLAAQLPPYPGDGQDGNSDRFITVPQTAYVARHGLGHFDLSMQALREMTMRCTAEWGIRPFLVQFPEKTLAMLAKWAADPHPHVRRLVSEGSRPHLPWGKKLKQFEDDPSPTLRLLELLRNDPSEYVRRSVANHLNDHAKNHPEVVVQTLAGWQKKFPHKNMERLIRHATRTLVKNGHPGALELLGFRRGATVRLAELTVSQRVAIGGHLHFSFDLFSNGQKPQPLVIDYVVHFRKADGKLSPKVFKMTTLNLAPGKLASLEKRHSFRVITTRKYYAGKHLLAIQINGEETGKIEFELIEAG